MCTYACVHVSVSVSLCPPVRACILECAGMRMRLPVLVYARVCVCAFLPSSVCERELVNVRMSTRMIVHVCECALVVCNCGSKAVFLCRPAAFVPVAVCRRILFKRKKKNHEYFSRILPLGMLLLKHVADETKGNNKMTQIKKSFSKEVRKRTYNLLS